MSGDPKAELRPLRPEDLERVVEIDRRIMGRSRRLFFEKRLEAALADTDGFISMASEDGKGRVVGFAIARLQNGEFGDERCVAALDVIGVDPGCRGAGHGTLLLEGITGQLRTRNIDELRTQIDWHDRKLVQFFAASGFLLAPSHVLERPTSRNL